MTEPDEDWGPTVSGRGRRRRRLRPLRTLAIVVLIALIAVTALGFWASSRIPRQDVDGLAGAGRPMHVLVVGSDSRADLTREQQNELTVGRDEGGLRTDTIFLMTIRGSRVAVLAFPRDLWVTRCDGSTGRINAAEAIGGPSCLVTTIRELSGIPIQHHLTVSFGGFREVVDAVGGVEICLEDAISDRDAGIDLPAGCQRLDGVDALGYVRVRKIDNDLQRIQRQQTFLRALAGEVASPSTLFNPVRLVSLANETGGALTADRGLSPIGLARLALGARGLAGGASVTETVPSTIGRAGEASVLFLDEAAAGPLFRAFADGSILDQAGGDTGVRPEDVPVTVLNGAGAPGLARQVADLLEGRGYPIADVGNTDPRDRTLIQHTAAQRAGAELVASEIPGDVDLEETSSVTQVTVLLGRNAAARG
ncbi:LCP family protein [Nitriliruptor alkaliphilus]|uniref:LCP family protein n=1 Tax=Nitriliruptor alkaliphilus TaxID=427918 RepID=UPI0006966C4D|nr:LCP family protein [Nitriliruptor alkaliphilus]